MATYEQCTVVNLPAGEDLNGDVYEALKLNSSGRVVKTTAVTDVIVGFLAMDPGRTIAAGDEVAVAVVGGGGVGLAKAGTAITAGQVIVPDATAGRVAGEAAGVATHYPCGVALEAAADGAVFRVLFQAISESA